jgi:hypothetical protein
VEAEVSVSRIMPPKEAAKGKLAADLIGDNPRFNALRWQKKCPVRGSTKDGASDG